jgi:hypothetical protein
MKRKLVAVVVCVAMLGIAGGQPPPPPAEVPPPSLPITAPPAAGNVPAVQPTPSIPAPAVETAHDPLPRIDAPAPSTFDTLVKELQTVRAQKAELEKREKAITEALLKKFAEQKSQLEALGIAVTAPTPKLDEESAGLPIPSVKK